LLIIFDLDDTLIDTSGCITYYKLEDALVAMVGAGLALPDFTEALDLLRNLDRNAESAAAALSEFAEIMGAGKNLLDVGIREVYDSHPLDLPVFPMEGALELLGELGQHHQLALVSVGRPSRQMEKLKKAGIDSRIFSKIAVTEEKNKKPHYQTIVDELGYSAEDVLVCGDKILVDLMPARELGFRTVQIQWGRGLNFVRHKGDVDYSISALKELKNIVNSFISSF